MQLNVLFLRWQPVFSFSALKGAQDKECNPSLGLGKTEREFNMQVTNLNENIELIKTEETN